MKDKITIGQLAKLMKVSTHQIRYFEEKGVLAPASIEKNGYRMYGLKEVYILSHVLSLRALGIPVGKIKELFDIDNKDDYVGIMKKSVVEIEAQIKALEALKQKTNALIKSSEGLEDANTNFRIEALSTRNLCEVWRCTIDYVPTALDYYNFIGKVETKHDSHIYEVYYDDYCCLCTEVQTQGEHILEKGNYLCYDITIDSLEELNTGVLKFFDYAIANNIDLVKQLVIIEDTNLSIFDNKTLYIRIQMKVA